MRPEQSPDNAPSTTPSASASGLARLASELVDLARDAPEQLKSRVAQLSIREQAELALRLPAGQRLELLLHAPKPMRLVRALPDSELYMTVREVGPEDGQPLMALASAAQLLHLMDLESWRGDRFDFDRAGAWIAVLVDVGEPTLKRFLLSADDEVLTLLVAGWMRVEPIETGEDQEIHGTGEGEAGTEKGYLTPDGFHRFNPKLEAHAPAIRAILQLFFVSQPQRYQRVIWGARWELPSDIEESAYSWRQSRLEEHGFPPWEQAMEVFNPPAAEQPRPEPLEPLTEDGLAAPRSPLRLHSQQQALAPVIDGLSDALRERVLHEILSVANSVLIATRADAGDPRQHHSALETAAGYIQIALDHITAGQTDSIMTSEQPNHAQGTAVPALMAAKTRLLEEIPALELFRRGYARAEELQRRAMDLKSSGWAAAHPRALELVDSPVRERVLGLLEPRPLYVALGADNGKDLLRELRTSDELAECRIALEVAELSGKILVDVAGLDVHAVCLEAGGESLPRLSRYFLTLMAWQSTRNELRGDPLSADVAADFLRTVASRRTASPEAPARALETLVSALNDLGTMTARELSIVQAYGRFCLDRLAQECAGMDPGVPPSKSDVSCLVLA